MAIGATLEGCGGHALTLATRAPAMAVAARVCDADSLV
jgi:hypothetical protein